MSFFKVDYTVAPVNKCHGEKRMCQILISSLPGSVFSTIEVLHPPHEYDHRGLKGSSLLLWPQNLLGD